MQVWTVELDRAIDTERVLDDRYLVLSSTRVSGHEGGLILEVDCDDDAANDLRLRPDVVSVTPK